MPLVAASSLFIFPPFPSEQSFHRRNTKKGKGSSPLKGVAAYSIYSPGHLKMAVFIISDNFMFLMVLCGSNCQQDILCIVCLADADKSHLTHNRGNSPSWEMENYIFDLLACLYLSQTLGNVWAIHLEMFELYTWKCLGNTLGNV